MARRVGWRRQDILSRRRRSGEAASRSSGFAWWSGTGPPYKITTGSIVTVDIVVEQVRPISLVIPALRKLLSLEG